MKKRLLLFMIAIFAISLIACNKDDDNVVTPTPEPTPEPKPEISNARVIEGLYQLDMIAVCDTITDTLSQTINLIPQGDNYVQLKTNSVSFKVNKKAIGIITIDSIPVTSTEGVYTFGVSGKKIDLTSLKETLATVKGVWNGKSLKVAMGLKTETDTISLNFQGAPTLNNQASILKMTIDSDVISAQPEISGTTITFYVKPGTDLSKLQLAPTLELSKGAIVKPASGEVVDFSGAEDNGDDTKYVKYAVVAENFSVTKSYNVKFVAIQTFNVSKNTFDEAWELENKDMEDYTRPAGGAWSTSNLGIGMIKLFEGLYDGGAIVSQTTDAQQGKAADITTAYTTGMASIVPGVFPAIPVITSGSLFLGSFVVDAQNTLNSTQFGIPYFKKPLSVKGYYKYTPGKDYYYCADPANNSNVAEIDPNKTDECALSAILYEVAPNYKDFLNGITAFTSDKIVAMAQITSGKQDTFKAFELKLDYKKAYDPSKNYKFAVIFSSSKDGDKFCGAGGSKLIVDEVEIIDE